MPIFFKYLQYRAKYLLLLLFFAAVFFAVFALFQISLLAVGYALLICLFFALIIFAADFSAFRKKHAALQALAKQIALSLECLPPPHGLFEEDYQVLLKTLFADRAQKLTQLGQKADRGAGILYAVGAPDQDSHRRHAAAAAKRRARPSAAFCRAF